MKVALYFSLFILTLSCNVQKKLQGSFRSSCNLYNQTSLKLTLIENGEFQYQFAYNDEQNKGKWEILNDTLLLESAIFLEKREALSPQIKNSDFTGVDKYKIKKNKLFVINKNGISNKCYLIEVK
jgi:hypothetical protein